MLEARRDLVAGAFAHAPGAVALVALDGRLLRANVALCDLLGYSEAELLTRTVPEITYPDDIELDLDNMRRMIAGASRSYQMEKRYFHSRGHLVTVLLSKALIRDAQGEPEYFISHLQDISERKRSEHATERAVARLREAQRIGQMGDWELVLDPRTMTWSPQVFDVLGRDPALGPPASDEEYAALFDRASRPLMARAAEGAIAGEPQDCELAGRRPNGEPFHVRVLVVPMHDPSGAVCGLHGTVQDITARKRDHDALVEREAELKETQRLAGLGTWYLDLPSRSIAWSDQTFSMLGLDPALGPPSYRQLAKMLEAASFANLDTSLNETVQQGTPFQIEVKGLHADQSPFWIVVRGEPVRDTAGAIVAVRGTALNITTRKLADEALRASEAEFRTLAESMPQIVWVTDSDGRVMYFNQKWMAYTGLGLEQSLGDNWTLPFHPDDRQRSWDSWHLAVTSEGPYSLECRLRRADGAYRWWLTRGVPQRDAAGQIQKWFGTCTDVHDMKLAQESLRLLESAVGQASESVMITDADLDPPGPRIVFVNPAYTRMTGYTSEEVIGKTPRMLQGPKTDRAVLSRLRRDLERGDAFEGETINYRKDGTEFALEWQIAPVRNAAGELTHYVALQRDVTERRRVQAELAATHKQLVTSSRLAGMAEVATNVLHNVGNVLNSVNVSAGMAMATVDNSRVANLGKVVQLLQEHDRDLGAFIADDPRGRRLPAYLGQLSDHLVAEQKVTLQELQSLVKNIDHIKSIVARQQEHARGSDIREVVDIRQVVEDGLSIDGCTATGNGVQIVREFEKVPAIHTDKHKLLQILVNLIGNARQSCEDSQRELPDPVGRRMTLGLGCYGERIRISVTDNGVGISPDNLPRIFSHGFTTREHGHGFGLHGGALAARELGGSLDVHSDGPGLGATFTLELPFDPGQA